MFMYYCGQKGSKFGELKMVSNSSKSAQKSRKPCWKQKFSWGGMPPNPHRNAQRLRRARDMSSTCAGRPLLVLHNFPFFSLLLSIMPVYNIICEFFFWFWVTILLCLRIWCTFIRTKTFTHPSDKSCIYPWLWSHLMFYLISKFVFK